MNQSWAGFLFRHFFIKNLSPASIARNRTLSAEGMVVFSSHCLKEYIQEHRLQAGKDLRRKSLT